MSEPDLRHVLSAIDNALAIFRRQTGVALNAEEVRARLSLAGARRQLTEQLARVMGAEKKQSARE